MAAAIHSSWGFPCSPAEAAEIARQRPTVTGQTLAELGLELVVDGSQKRLIATRAFEPGDVLFKDKPVARFLLPSLDTACVTCAQCQKYCGTPADQVEAVLSTLDDPEEAAEHVALPAIPGVTDIALSDGDDCYCPHCSALFCGPLCRQIAMTTWHRVMCPGAWRSGMCVCVRARLGVHMLERC